MPLNRETVTAGLECFSQTWILVGYFSILCLEMCLDSTLDVFLAVIPMDFFTHQIWHLQLTPVF